MSRHLTLAGALAVMLVFGTDRSSGQTTNDSSNQVGGVVLSKLSPPLYPPLARQARITGDVDVILNIRSDGTINSATVFSGHPILRQAALESAQQSNFDCRACTGNVPPYSLRYKFELIPLDSTKDCAALTDEERNAYPPPQVDFSQHEVTVFAKVAETCDPAVELRKVRSVKCLYLWKCGVREITP